MGYTLHNRPDPINLTRIAKDQNPSIKDEAPAIRIPKKGQNFSNDSWLKKHLDEFVKPVLKDKTPYCLPSGYKYYFTTSQMTMLKNIWRAVKKAAKGRVILLPGRDSYVFEVLARRENTPTIFKPEFSSSVVGNTHVPIDLTPYQNCFCVDSGYSGSIPRKLKVPEWLLVKATIADQNFQEKPDPVMGLFPHNYPMGILPPSRRRMLMVEDKSPQVFPKMYQGSVSIASKMEGSPRYWDSGIVRKNKDTDKWEIHQSLFAHDSFLRAALFTIELYTDSSPRFIEKPVQTHLSGGDRWIFNYPTFKDQMDKINYPGYIRCPELGCQGWISKNNQCPFHLSRRGFPISKNNKVHLEVWEGE